MKGLNITYNKNKPSPNPLNELNNFLNLIKIMEYKKCHIVIQGLFIFITGPRRPSSMRAAIFCHCSTSTMATHGRKNIWTEPKPAGSVPMDVRIYGRSTKSQLRRGGQTN